MTRPLLDNIELQQVQEMETEQDQVLVQHSVPALEGDFLQRLDRRATQVTLIGVLTGPEIADGLKTLRQKFRAAQPVPFVADITTATKVDQVLIEEMGVRELAGKPERFEYAFTLREFIAPPAEETEEPPIPPEEPPDPEVATLEVEVIVEGDPNFDFNTTTVTVEGTQEDGTDLSRTLTNREDNIWTETDFPPGQYTARAVVSEPSMAGTADAVVRAGQTTRVTITLRRGQVTNIAKAFIVHFRFDKAFVEPCMRHVLKQVADYASAHSDEKLVIVGHTDKVGSDAYNQSLSERRARSVYAYLTIARDRVTALAEWDQLHRPRPSGTQLSINDSWGVREYQHILQDLVYYSGNVDGDDGPLTDSAVRTFQGDKGLTVDGIVGDQTWAALIDTYLSQDALAVPESQFLPNAKDGCDGGILKWLGCGEQDPVRNTQDAWRPNRRTELLFVSADALPCEVPQPDTFDLPSPRAVNNTWCLGPGDPNQRCCFVTRDTEQPGKWLVQPAEPGTITVRGRITFDDGTPVANARYVLIAPDGEFMDGETPAGSHRGEGIPGRTGVDGAFEYPDKPKDIGTYTLDIQGPFVARLEGEPSEAARGNVVCKRLDGSSDFNVIVCTPAVTFDLQVTDAVQIGGSASRTFLATRALSGDVIVTAVFPSGMCTAPRSITWTGGEEVPGNPLQRRVPRATVAQTTVTAMMPSTGMSKSVTIMVITVQLEAVKFNHDPTAATTDALNIRKNSTQTVAVPEWQRNISVNPIDSPVAYAINETRGNIITIQAKFQLAFPVTLTTEIRAVPQTPHVLGEVQGKQVTFLPTGETNFETFELQNVQIWDNSVGVGNHDITWMWQFRLQPANPWTDFVTSQHRIYAVLEVPKLPWQQMPFDSSNTQLPWTDVLEYACGWASGAINLDDAATKVTTEVYNLGTSILEYDCPGGGGTHYAFPDFNCTAFLERLGGGAGAGRYVNCSDCATIVSTFANILGCDLWQSRMGNSFDLNPILAIGSSTWQTACGWGGFSYHEVAWKGACTSSEEVFDACLQVDGDADPTAPPHTPLQPTNLRFGNIGDGQYRDRLAADTPTGRSNCRPQPSTRMRRRIV